jgi:hypothetical protein
MIKESFTIAPRHFASMEEPDLLVKEIRTFFRTSR